MNLLVCESDHVELSKSSVGSEQTCDAQKPCQEGVSDEGLRSGDNNICSNVNGRGATSTEDSAAVHTVAAKASNLAVGNRDGAAVAVSSIDCGGGSIIVDSSHTAPICSRGDSSGGLNSFLAELLNS